MARHLAALAAAGWLLVMSWLVLRAPWGSDYPGRRFGPGERTLASVAILPQYMAKVALPSEAALSIEHSPRLPRFTPLTFAWIVFLGATVHHARKRYPAVFFGLVSWLLLLSLESGPVNLEPVFDHRAYLPSLFLLLALISGILPDHE